MHTLPEGSGRQKGKVVLVWLAPRCPRGASVALKEKLAGVIRRVAVK